MEILKGDADLTSDMKFKNLLIADQKYPSLFGFGGDPVNNIS